jgi:hypothetical protein
MSFDLKPEIPISILTKSVDEIVWTVSRSPVPPVLAGRDISDLMWARTFDMVRGHYDAQLSSNSSLIKPWFFIPCFVPCTMAKMIQMNKERQNGWLEILKSQEEIYQRFGVQVTLARTMSSSSGSNSGGQMYTVGLQFTVAGIAESCYSPCKIKFEEKNNVNISTSTQSSSIEERLGKLRSIKHVLTDQEYEEKRKEILSQI